LANKKADERLWDVKKRQRNFFITTGLILVISISIFAFYKYSNTMKEDNPTEYQPSEATGNNIILKTSGISDGNFHYYSQNIDGVNVKYFVVADPNGEVHTAFDACEVCYNAKLGYVQKGDDAQCRNCGRTFSINGLGTQNVDGEGCWPGYLPHTLDGDTLQITKTDLDKGSYLFS